MFPQLSGAIQELDRPRAAKTRSPSYRRLLLAEVILRDPDASISHHSWGIAFDINVRTNHFGATPHHDPRLVARDRAVGFIWGGDFIVPDGNHFEYRRPPAERRNASRGGSAAAFGTGHARREQRACASLHLLGCRPAEASGHPSMPPAAGRAWVSAPFAVTRSDRSGSTPPLGREPAVGQARRPMTAPRRLALPPRDPRSADRGRTQSSRRSRRRRRRRRQLRSVSAVVGTLREAHAQTHRTAEVADLPPVRLRLPPKLPVGVHGDRMADRLEHREVGDRVRVRVGGLEVDAVPLRRARGSPPPSPPRSSRTRARRCSVPSTTSARVAMTPATPKCRCERTHDLLGRAATRCRCAAPAHGAAPSGRAPPGTRTGRSRRSARRATSCFHLGAGPTPG